MIQTAEGALNETHSILQRQREIANQSANGTNTDSDRQALQDEMNQLTSEINRIGNTTEFNTQKLLNGGIGSGESGKLTQATSATVELGAVTGAAVAAGTFIKVDGQTFNLEGVVTTGNNADSATLLGNVTSGGTKLSDLVDIKVGATGLEFTAKSEGKNSKIEFSQAADAAIGLGAAQAATVGTPSTVERAGLEASTALSTAAGGNAAITLAANSSFKVTVGSDSAVEVSLGDTAKTYDTDNVDKNVAKAAKDDLVKDLNAALQKQVWIAK